MDAGLTSAASAIQQAKVQNEVAAAIASKSLQTTKQQGEAAVDLIKQAAAVSSQIKSGRLDVSL